MRKIFVLLGVAAIMIYSASAQAEEQATSAGFNIHGAGATFPKNIYYRWILNYFINERILVRYDGIGSGGGIRRISADEVDFGASDAPLTEDKLTKANLIQFPMILGGIGVAINVPGIACDELKMTGDVVARIFMGHIRKWNDLAIARLNPGADLPDLPIVPIHRQHGSGTTWVFTQYLTQASPLWRARIGFGKKVNWPLGRETVGNGNMARDIYDVPGAIGYVEYSYAKMLQLTTVRLQNQSGKYVTLSTQGIQAAASHADWGSAKGNYMLLVNQPGEQSWPITAASYILLRTDAVDAGKIRMMTDFFDWCLSRGGKYAEPMGYVRLPDEVVAISRATWQQQLQKPSIKAVATVENR